MKTSLPPTVDLRLIRAYVGEADRVSEQRLYKVLDRSALDHGATTAIAIRGVMGLSRSGRIRRSRLFHHRENLPVIVEAVGEAEAVSHIAAAWREVAPSATMTVQRVWPDAHRRSPV